MANRSDFHSALPRQFKRTIALGGIVGHVDTKAARKAFVEAHRIHKNFKNKKNKLITSLDDSED